MGEPFRCGWVGDDGDVGGCRLPECASCFPSLAEARVYVLERMLRYDGCEVLGVFASRHAAESSVGGHWEHFDSDERGLISKQGDADDYPAGALYVTEWVVVASSAASLPTNSNDTE